MTNRVYIDNIDIYLNYGIILLEGSHSDLLNVASLIEPEANDWPECDGIETDLSNPVLDNKTVSLEFASVTTDNLNVDNFLDFLSAPGYRTIRIDYLDNSWKLRIDSENSRVVYHQGETFTIQFIDDFPDATLTGGIKSGHGSNVQAPAQDYYIDDVPLNEFGIVVLEGTKSDIYKMPSVKENLIIKSQYVHGAKYDTGFIRFKTKEVTLHGAFYCDTLQRFWNNYRAFFSKLIQPEERRLYVKYAFDEYQCYYKNTSDFQLAMSAGVVVCKFSLNLVFTDFRPKKAVEVWGSEDGRIIKTEDNLNAIKK